MSVYSQSTGAYYNYETECLGIEHDGSQTLRVWANGRNRSDALEQGRKNAVYEVLFTGVKKGNGGCESKPLLIEVNAREKYQYYFNPFFKDKGEYLKYVSMEDSRVGTKKREKRREQVKFGVTVRVLREELKNKLIEDKIIKP